MKVWSILSHSLSLYLSLTKSSLSLHFFVSLIKLCLSYYPALEDASKLFDEMPKRHNLHLVCYRCTSGPTVFSFSVVKFIALKQCLSLMGDVFVNVSSDGRFVEEQNVCNPCHCCGIFGYIGHCSHLPSWHYQSPCPGSLSFPPCSFHRSFILFHS